MNKGAIFGGNGDGSVVGGSGILLQDAVMFLNTGEIGGGGGGGNGASLAATALLKNSGSISGGDGGGIGVDLSGSSLLTNSGTIVGGNAEGGLAGAAVAVNQLASVDNLGTIRGGLGANATQAANYNPGNGGVGIDVGTGAHAANFGTITGGQGGSAQNYAGEGGFGVVVSAGGSLTNAGTIVGGVGGGAERDNVPIRGFGGVGVLLEGGTVTNNGHILGATCSSTYAASVGGTGVVVSGGTLINNGVIAGGATVQASNYGVPFGSPYGGTGVVVINGTLVASGTIIGGDNAQSGRGNAVDLSNSTLVVNAGARFEGTVQAQGGVNILSLGAAGGTIAHLGTEFAGFNVIDNALDSTWTFADANVLTAVTSIVDEGTINIAGTLQDAGVVTLEGNSFSVTGDGQAVVDKIVLLGGNLVDSLDGRMAVGSSLSASASGAITIDSDGIVSGFGTIASPNGIVDNGLIAAQSQSLFTLEGNVSGAGTISIARDAILMVTGNLTVAKIMFGAGGSAQLQVGETAPLTSTIANFSTGDTILLTGVAANSFTYSAGTLDLFNGSSEVDQLHFSGTHLAADFGLVLYSDGETSITYTAAGSLVPLLSTHAGLALSDASKLPAPQDWLHHPMS